MDSAKDLKRTPLFQTHVESGAKMVAFGGWEMPLQYTGILDETRSVRNSAGIFDVSHMGRLNISGQSSADFLDRVFSSKVGNLTIGQARYGVICSEQGGIIDDCIVYRRCEENFQLVPNASNTSKILNWLYKWVEDQQEVIIDNVTSDFAMVALQGPSAASLLEELTPMDLKSIKPFRGIETIILDYDCFVARTGYTGEDGFELIIPKANVQEIWSALIKKGAKPCGLGARDLLRLEAGLLLHGNDINVTTNPYEAGLTRFISPHRENYVAMKAMNRILSEGINRTLIGFRLLERGIPRKGYSIELNGENIGTVTSGSHSPTLDMGIGLGYVPVKFSKIGTNVQINVRNRLVNSEITSLPFYSKGKLSES